MIILSFILAIIGAVLVGGGLFLADKVGFYLIVVMPIIGGAIIGFLVALPFFRRRAAYQQPVNLGGGLADVVVRDNRPAALPLVVVAIIGALIAMAVYWAASYTDFLMGQYEFYKTDMLEAVRTGQPGLSDEEAMVMINEFEQEETGSTGFLAFFKLAQEDSVLRPQGFIELLAETGITINRATSSSSGGINLQGGMAYAYWGLEILLLAGFAVGSALNRARGTTPAPQAAAAA